MAQEDLNTFLSVAEELKVKGLTQNETENKSPDRPYSRRGGLSKKSSQESQHKAASSDSQYRKYQQPHEDAEADIQEIVPVKTEAPGEMFEDQEYGETEYNEGYEYEEAAPEMDTSLMSAEVGNRGQLKHNITEMKIDKKQEECLIKCELVSACVTVLHVVTKPLPRPQI